MNIPDTGVEERRKYILEVLGREGKIRVSDLSRHFDISEVTARSDLGSLEAEGLLERVRGGAVSTGRAQLNLSLKERIRQSEQEKRRIACEVASMIPEGAFIMMDSGSTSYYAYHQIKRIRDLTLVTNSLLIAQETGPRDPIRVILLGGSIDPRYQYTYGGDTLAQLKNYKADIMILSTDGLTAENGITTHHHFEAEISRQMIQSSGKLIVVADYTKIGKVSHVGVEAADAIHILVTNGNADAEEIRKIHAKGPAVRLV